jgi:GNAT superfamily N-acetyltransferase
VHIRIGTVADREEIVAFDHVAHADVGRVRFIDRILRSGACLVAEDDGRVIGYGSLEYTFYDHGFVSMTYVAEPERRRGVGRSIMKALAARCGTQKLFASTNQSNRAMQALLTELGYVPSGVIHNLDSGDPELVYFLDLEVDRARAAEG